MNEFVSLIRALRVGTTHWHPDHFSPVCFSEVQTENGNNESAVFNYTIRRWAMLKSAIRFAARRPITAVSVFIALLVHTFTSFLSLSLSSHCRCLLVWTSFNPFQRLKVKSPVSRHRHWHTDTTFSACNHVAFAHKWRRREQNRPQEFTCSLLRKKTTQLGSLKVSNLEVQLYLNSRSFPACYFVVFNGQCSEIVHKRKTMLEITNGFMHRWNWTEENGFCVRLQTKG